MKRKIKILFFLNIQSDASSIHRQLKKEKIEYASKLVKTKKDYLDALGLFSPDIILAGYSIPKFSGREALAIRNELAPSTPFILVTGSINELIAVDCMKAGADDYIIKDNLKRLGEAIRSALKKKEIVREKDIAEEALRTSELRFKTLTEYAPVGIFRTDLSGSTNYVNPRWCEIAKLSHEEALGSGWLNAVHPDDRKLVTSAWQRNVSAHTMSYSEYRFLHTDASVTWVNGKAVPLKDQNNNIIGYIGTITDITDRKLYEEKIHNERTMLRTLIDNLPSMIYILDKEGRKVIANIADTENIGYRTEAEILGKNDLELFPGEIGKRGHKDNQYVILSGIPIINREENFLDKNGEQRWLLTSKFPLYDVGGDVSGLVGMGHDITQRRRAEAKIIESEAYYRTLIDISPDAIITADMQGLVTYGSKRAYEIFEEPVGVSFVGTSFFNWLDPEYHQVIIKRFKDILSGEVKPVTGEYKLLKHDRTTFWAELSSCPITDAKGSTAGLLIVCRDISERKKAEEDLIKAKNKAEEGDKLKTAFLHNISHEIRTPLNAIVGFSALLQEPDVSFENQKSYIEFINQSSDNLLAVINDIIEISNIEAGILNYKQGEVNLNDLLINLHKQFNIQATEKGIKLSLKTGLADHKAEIKTDRAKLLQALSSLLTNALKFTSHGHIDFGYRLKNEFLEFFISDTGIGISEDQHLKIFNRFYKVEHSFSVLYDGTGLGLPICKAYVELLGGKIWLESKPGKGSTFYFTIHYEEVKKAIAHEHHNHNVEISDTDGLKTVLIAEDDDNNFKLIKELLSGLNIKIIRAYNGLEAVEICNEGPQIDLVLMDIKMPLIDGHTAARQILEHSPGMKIIAQTAFAGDEKLAMEAGCSGFIPKPFLKNQLINMIKEFL